MKNELLKKLICPLCKQKIIIDDSLKCPSCKQEYLYFNNILNMLPKDILLKYNPMLRDQNIFEEKEFYENMYKDLKGEDDGHCVVYGYDDLYNFCSTLPKGELLDLGCGAGQHTKDLAMMGYSVTGIDISLNGLIYADRLCKLSQLDTNLILGDIENMPFEDNSFDVVFCSLILHHFPKRTKLLSEIARVCKKYLIAFEVNAHEPITFIRFNIINQTIGIHNITKNQRSIFPHILQNELSKLGFNSFDIKFIDVHHNIGRNPHSFATFALNFINKITNKLPNKYKYNKFLLKCEK